MADDQKSFMIQLMVDGQTRQLEATPALVCALNSSDPMIRHQAYRMIAEEAEIIPPESSCPHSESSCYQTKGTSSHTDGAFSQTESASSNTEGACSQTEGASSQVESKNVEDQTQNEDAYLDDHVNKCPFHWSHDATLEIIALYQNFTQEGKTIKPKRLWELISSSMKEKGYEVDELQVSNKWKSLKRSYKEVIDHNQKSGNERKTHPYQTQLDAIFRDKPNITPLAVASSSNQIPKRKYCPGECKDEPQGKARKSGASEVVSFLQDYAAKQEQRYKEESQRLEAMHKEKLDLFKELISTFKGQ